MSASHLVILLDDDLVMSLLDEARALDVDPAEVFTSRLRETLPAALIEIAQRALAEILLAEEFDEPVALTRGGSVP